VAHLLRLGAARRSLPGQADSLNACPVKDDCTTSPHGREVIREIDPWPHSEAGRFHRGIACWVAVIGIFLPLGMLLSRPDPVDLLALLGTTALIGLASLPLARHMWNTPSGFPEHIPQQALYEEPPKDRFATRWGSARHSPARNSRTSSREVE
jgi:hypothetical protein